MAFDNSNGGEESDIIEMISGKNWSLLKSGQLVFSTLKRNSQTRYMDRECGLLDANVRNIITTQLSFYLSLYRTAIGSTDSCRANNGPI